MLVQDLVSAMERIAPEGLFPPPLVGLGAAIFGMVAVSLAPPIAGGRGHPGVGHDHDHDHAHTHDHDHVHAAT